MAARGSAAGGPNRKRPLSGLTMVLLQLEVNLVTLSARVSLACATGCILTLSAGAVTLVIGNKGLGWWLISLSLIGGVIGAGFIVLGQQSMARAAALSSQRSGALANAFADGKDPSKKTKADAVQTRWVGSASVPSSLGYVVVTQPLAVLEVRQTGLSFRVRPRLARTIFGIKDLVVIPGNGVVVFPARRLGAVGVEVRIPEQPSYYFWTKRRNEVMATAASLGLEVSDQEQPMGRA
jgi:hypothetical protein